MFAVVKGYLKLINANKISSPTWASTFFGTLEQWSNIDCENFRTCGNSTRFKRNKEKARFIFGLFGVVLICQQKIRLELILMPKSLKDLASGMDWSPIWYRRESEIMVSPIWITKQTGPVDTILYAAQFSQFSAMFWIAYSYFCCYMPGNSKKVIHTGSANIISKR